MNRDLLPDSLKTQLKTYARGEVFYLYAPPRFVIPEMLKKTHFLLFICVVVIIMVVSSIPSILNKNQAYERLIANEPVQGEIIKRRVHEGKSNSYYVTYRFEVNGVTYQDEERLTNREYNTYLNATEVTLQYDPLNPAYSAIVGNTHSPIAQLTQNIFLGLMVISGVIFYWLGLRQRQKIIMNGQLVEGEIVAASCELTYRKQRYYPYERLYRLRIDFTFVSPTTGKTIRDFKNQFSPESEQPDIPALKTKVLILYENDERWHIL